VGLQGDGYFDKALRDMKTILGVNAAELGFNREFESLLPGFGRDEVLIQKNSHTNRGHAEFVFLGPGPDELQGLSEFFKENRNTAGSIRDLRAVDM
jgi:hypothetical protein